MKKSLFLILVLFGTAAHAGLNKWIDDQGRVHYGDQPPPGATASSIHTTTTAPGPASGTGTEPQTPTQTKSYAEREAELKKARQAKEAAAAEAAKKQSEAETRKANCENARQNLAARQSGARMAEYDANGERRYLEDDELRQRTAEAQQAVDNWCK